jgi:hypothetical protein
MAGYTSKEHNLPLATILLRDRREAAIVIYIASLRFRTCPDRYTRRRKACQNPLALVLFTTIVLAFKKISMHPMCFLRFVFFKRKSLHPTLN